MSPAKPKDRGERGENPSPGAPPTPMNALETRPNFFLRTKLLPPRPAPELLSRTRLTDRLLANLSHPLTLVTANAGSGKTTLLRIIAGLEVADSGTVLYQEEDVTHHSARDRKVGFVFQHYALFRHMTVAENIGYGLKVRKTPKAQIRERVNELLK